MRRIFYITEDKLHVLKEANEMEEVTFYSFFNKIKNFIKQLLHDPINSEPDKIFKLNGIGKTTLLKKMLNRNIIEKKQKIEEVDGSARYYIQYKVPKRNFELKIRRLYSELFEKNINENTEENIDGIDDMAKGGLNCAENYGNSATEYPAIEQVGYEYYVGNYPMDNVLRDKDVIKSANSHKSLKENAISEDGAASCVGVGAIGDGSDSSGQYTTPLFGMMHRSFWNAGNIQPTMKRVGSSSHKKHKKHKRHAKL
jgi:hypothetical protein